MNKIAIIAGICGVVVGTTGGYFACHIIEKKKIDKAISDGIQQTLDEIRGKQKEKIMENENKKNEIIKTTGRNINPIPHLNVKNIVADIVEENGYDGKEPDGAPDDDDDLPFEVGEVEKHNIWDEEEPDEDSITQEEYDDEQGPDTSLIDKLDPREPPYPITKEQYDEELLKETGDGVWDKVSLIFFTDNVFAERASFNEFTVMSSEEIEAAIGKDNMKHFISDRSLGRAFVRNNKLHIDYEIVRSPRSYSSALREDEEE